jgi:hypothetical protein
VIVEPCAASSAHFHDDSGGDHAADRCPSHGAFSELTGSSWRAPKRLAKSTTYRVRNLFKPERIRRVSLPAYMTVNSSGGPASVHLTSTSWQRRTRLPTGCP